MRRFALFMVDATHKLQGYFIETGVIIQLARRQCNGHEVCLHIINVHYKELVKNAKHILSSVMFHVAGNM